MNIKHYILLPISALLLASCASDEAANNAPSTDDRLPLRFETSLSSERPLTRAYDKTIETTDELLSYVRHVYSDNENRTSVQASLVKIKDNKPTDALYWDNFSEFTEDGSKDLRTAGHGLQSYYGYCYNGGTPSTALTEVTGVLGWETGADQSTSGIKPYDLLWSDEQNPVTYQHAKDARGTINVPYTHAMSKFTVVVVAGEGFKADDLTTATVTLHGMNLKGTFTAPTAEVVAEESTINVKMHGLNPATTTDNKPCRAFEAVVVPNTALNGNEQQLATIEMHGNNYKVMVSDNMLTSLETGLTEGKTQSGVNYKLTVTLNKQAVAVTASLADWTDVSAEGTGEILFANDVTEQGTNDTSLKSGDSFRLWMAKEGEAFATDATTTATYDGTSKTFTNSPAIYWPNGKDQFFFRALSGNTGLEVAQGSDVLWGTSGDVAIAPRTGTVPLTFTHAMSKISFDLQTTDGADKVDLTDAKISISNLSTAGTINVGDGAITGNALTAEAISNLTDDEPIIVLPQSITNDAVLTVILSDDTKYKLQLNLCKDKNDAVITTWERGKNYAYTITLKKEDVKFSAVIKDWDPKSGSGNATLDWD